jgi:hypothetical protein
MMLKGRRHAGKGKRMVRAELIRWLQGRRLAGWQALICMLLAVWIPSIIRLAANGAVTGCEFTPYLPFVLICAIMLRWWQAAIVALLSVATVGGLFGGSPAFAFSCFMPAAGIFLASSASMIAIAQGIRLAFSAMQKRGADESLGGIVFSLEKGEVWASWYGNGPPVLLGSQFKVSEMMQDFLKQEELGKRFNQN